MNTLQPELFSEHDRRATWQAFDSKTDDDQARQRFTARYGVQPAMIRRAGPLVLAGPIPDQGVTR